MIPPPSFSALFWNDRTIRGSIQAIVMAVLFAGGFYWVTQPVPGVAPIPGPSFEEEIAPFVPLVTGTLAAIGLIVLLRRYLFIRNTLTRGIIVKGRVEEMDMVETQTSDGNTPAFQRNYRRTYFATVRYSLTDGTPRTACIRLPNSPSAHGVFKDKDIDLVVLESSPTKPLIKSVYVSK